MTFHIDHDKALNRLRAAAGLIPIIESGLSKAQITPDRVEKMCRFCEWSLQVNVTDETEIAKLRIVIKRGLERINDLIAHYGPIA